MTVNQKYKTAFSTQWKVPGILAGNEVPSWADNSGSIQRRLVVFDFAKQVVNGDMRLAEKLQSEIPTLLLKCNRMYLEAVEQYGSANIWNVLPAYFLGTRDSIAQSTNVVEAFINSEEVTLDVNGYVSFEDFKAALRYYANQNNYGIKRFNWEYFRTAFDKFGISKDRRQMPYQGRTVNKEFLFGISLTSTDTE
jgi:phage/plasmid-associated DNA primase